MHGISDHSGSTVKGASGKSRGDENIGFGKDTVDFSVSGETESIGKGGWSGCLGRWWCRREKQK